jgi:ABC-type branched-subunit amino acid transport system ATPase component
VTREPDHRRVQRGMARSFQVTSLFLTLPVRENLRLAARAWRRGALDCWRARGARATEVVRACSSAGPAAVADTPAGNLSHGQQRRLEVGMALAARPKAIFLDEPTSGMGIDDLDDMKRLIQGLRDEHTVVLIEHNMNIVMDISDTITVMQQGACWPRRAARDPQRRPRAQRLPGQHDHRRQGMILSLNEVHAHYGKSHVLQGVSCRCRTASWSRCWAATARARPPRSRPSRRDAPSAGSVRCSARSCRAARRTHRAGRLPGARAPRHLQAADGRGEPAAGPAQFALAAGRHLPHLPAPQGAAQNGGASSRAASSRCWPSAAR